MTGVSSRGGPDGDAGERLRARVHANVVPRLAAALTEARGSEPPGRDALDETHRTTLALLYRLLFLAYAEHEILPRPCEAGDDVVLGPDEHGNYESIRVKSIEKHHRRVDAASAGDIVGIALKGGDPERGMVLCREEEASTVREFEAEVMVLNHPTKISDGYEPVVHMETISEATEFIMDDYLVAGESGEVTMRFRYRPYCVSEGQRFVFREGSSKGIGRVTSVPDA